MIPHIDVYIHDRGHTGRDFCTLVTGGMSDLPMSLPSGVTGAPRRVELIFYCSEPKEEYLQTIRWLARFPHDEKTWLGSSHTIPNGNPPEPFWGSSVLDTLLLMPTIVRPDGGLSDELSLAGDPVHFSLGGSVDNAGMQFEIGEGVRCDTRPVRKTSPSPCV